MDGPNAPGDRNDIAVKNLVLGVYGGDVPGWVWDKGPEQKSVEQARRRS
jgi:hypothetical protein